MIYANYSDVIDQLTSHGLQIDSLEVDTARVQRCKTACNPREKRGWYWLSSIDIEGDSYIVGAYGIFVGNDNGKQKVTLDRQRTSSLSDDQKQALAAQQREAKKKADAAREAQHNRAAERAKTEWAKLSASGHSEYLERKQVGAHGVRFGHQGEVIVPMRDGSGSIRGLQLILPAGHPRINKIGRNKEFFPAGLGMSGTWHLIGEQPRNLLLVAEGYATAASLHQATGYPVAVLWSANNLLAGCSALRKKYPRSKILICADNDAIQACAACGQYTTVTTPQCDHCGEEHRKNNAGTTSAQAAAIAIDGAWVAPEFAQQVTDKSASDYNDLHISQGLNTVSAQIHAKIDQLGWLSPTLAGTPHQGDGGKRQALKSMIDIDEAIDRFYLVYGGKGTMFDKQEHRLVPKADVLDILPEHGWRDMRAHKTVVRMEEVGFDPAGTDKKIICNLYGGWPTEPKQGDCRQLLELLRYLCSNDTDSAEIYTWVLRWLAYPIQNPGAKMQSALIVHGPQGTGKNLFFEAIMAIYGEYGRIVDQAAIEDKFNDWASRKLFLVADEVVARAELYHVKNKLKSLVTGEWIRINPKNVAAYEEKNHVNMVFLSNEATPLVLEHDDRRYMVIHTPDKLPQDFYKNVRAEIDNGGIAALHHHLKTIDLGDFSIYTKPLRTRAKQQLIDASLDSVSSFLREWYLGEIDRIPFCPCTISHLFTIYQRYCASIAERFPRDRKQFIAQLNMQNGWRIDAVVKILIGGNRISKKMVIQPQELLKEADAAREDGPLGHEKYAKQENETKETWLGRCYEAFKTAGKLEQ